MGEINSGSNYKTLNILYLNNNKYYNNYNDKICSTPAGEGLDFKAEVVNKKVQAWMPRGVPTGEDWLRVTRNLDVIEQVISKMV